MTTTFTRNQIWLRSLYRVMLRWWTRLTVRRLERVRVEYVDGVELVMLPGVFDGVRLRTGAILARALDTLPLDGRTRVLDLGTGSGIAAVFAARRGAQVVATDINPESARCARINALVHGLEARIEARVGDLFAPIGDDRFDLILFNPPYFRGPPRNMAERAWRSPDVFDRFLRELPAHLNERGRALVVLSSDNDVEPALHAAEHLQVNVLKRHDLINEVVTVYEVVVGAQHAAPLQAK
jgi:release factor glutamine methyltransferase